jgi:hypothetical protein
VVTALSIATACSLLSACAFHLSPPGTLDDAGPTVDGTAQDVLDAATCAAPTIIDDRFENTDLATTGPLSIGNGFEAVTNTSSGNGTSAELTGAGLEIRTSNNAPPQSPAHGAASNTSFAFNPAGMTVRLEVIAADTPIWNGIALGLQSNKGNIDNVGGALVLRIRGQGTNTFNVDMGNQATYAAPLGLQPYDEAELADGFIVTWRLGASSWSYVVEGLRSGGASLTDAGTYRPGETPADVLDATVHLGIHIQGNPNDMSPRILRVKRVTLWDGDCS